MELALRMQKSNPALLDGLDSRACVATKQCPAGALGFAAPAGQHYVGSSMERFTGSRLAVSMATPGWTLKCAYLLDRAHFGITSVEMSLNSLRRQDIRIQIRRARAYNFTPGMIEPRRLTE